MTDTIISQKNIAIQVKNLTRSFNDRPALRGVDVEFFEGESVGILGPNGAGKTTLLKVMATILSPSSGEVIINGFNLKEKDPEVRRRIGVVSHHQYLYQDLTAYENLSFYTRMYDVEKPDSRIKEVIEKVGLTERLHERVSTYSRGMQQRLSIARALLHKPDVLLLDEPDTGLDRQAMSSLWEIVKNEPDKNRTVIFTTHDIRRGISLSDRILIIHKGRIVLDKQTINLHIETVQQAYAELTGVNV